MSTDFGIISMKMVGSLMLILGLIILLFYLLKRLRLSPLCNNRIPVMRILGTLNLAPKRAIALIEVCNQWLIVGIGTENVTLISRLDQPPELDNPVTGVSTNGRRFHSFLQNISLGQRGRESIDTKKNAET